MNLGQTETILFSTVPRIKIASFYSSEHSFADVNVPIVKSARIVVVTRQVFENVCKLYELISLNYNLATGACYGAKFVMKIAGLGGDTAIKP